MRTAPLQHHPVGKLFSDLHRLGPYPKGVVPVPEQICGTNFFPGGTGLWCEGSPTIPPLPLNGAMILGHDFHSVAGYQWALEHGPENLRSPTWLNMTAFLARVPIALDQCFFTNAYMGLREGEAVTGRFPGADCPEFVASCRDFFIHQFQLLQPKLVLALGAYVPAFLAPLSQQLGCWASGSFSRRDAEEKSLVGNVLFDGGSRSCVVASIVHPCLRRSNVRHRRWRGKAGDAAELELVMEAKALAGLWPA